MKAADFECERVFSWRRQLGQLVKWNVVLKKREPAFVVNDVLGTVLFLFILVMLNLGLSTFPGSFSINQLPTLSSLCPDQSNCVALAYVSPNNSIPQSAARSILDELALLIADSEPLFTAKNALLSFPTADSMQEYRKLNPNRFRIGFEFDSLNATSFDCSYYIWVLDNVFNSFSQDYSSVGYTTAQAYVDRAIINAQRAAGSTGVPKLQSPLRYTGNNGVRTAQINVKIKSAGVWVVFYMILMFQTVTANATRALANDKKLLRPGMVVMGMNETVYITAVMLVQIGTSVPIILLVALVLCTFGKVFIYTSALLICLVLVLYTILCSIFGYFLSVIFPDPRQSTGMSFIALYMGLGMYAIGKISLFDKAAIPEAVQTLWLLSPHACFGRVLDLLSFQETILQSVTLSNLSAYPKIQVALGMLAVDCWFWFALSWVIEKVRPGKGKLGLPISFLVDKAFWFPDTIIDNGFSGDISIDELAPIPHSGDGSVSENVETVDFSAVNEKDRCSVRIAQVTKVFPAKKKNTKRKTGGGKAFLGKFFGKKRRQEDIEEDKEKVEETETVALSNVSLDLHSGQTLALLGHNGSGKTTLLSILNGDLQPTSGKMLVKLKNNSSRGFSYLDTSKVKELGLIRRSLGVCPQFDVLFPSFTCREHLVLYAALKGVTVLPLPDATSTKTQQELLAEYINSLLQDVDLHHKANVRTASLSGGQKRKLSLAIALLGNPSMILLDEPTSGMDVGATEKVWKLIQEIKGSRTIIITTHSMEEADTLGDRVAILNKGEFQAIGTSMFLKGKFGVGYRMVVGLKEGCDVAGGGLDQVVSVVKSVFGVAEVEVTHATGTITLVKAEGSTDGDYAKCLADLFSKLNGMLDRGELGNVSAIGLGQTTLEHVFLALNDGAEK